MHKTKLLQECRSYAAISILLSCASGNPSWSNDLCSMLFSQHVDVATMQNYYIVLANVNGHFGLDDGVFSPFRNLGSHDKLKMWPTSEDWSNGKSLFDLRKFVGICFSTQFPSEDALSGKNMQSEPFRSCKLCDWNHVGVLHECRLCSVMRFVDSMKLSPTYFPSPIIIGCHLNLIDWLKHCWSGPMTAFPYPPFHFGSVKSEGQLPCLDTSSCLGASSSLLVKLLTQDLSNAFHCG